MSRVTIERRYTIPESRRALPLIYRFLTAEEATELANGCGAKGGWLAVPDYVWTLSCHAHDVCYFVGGDEGARRKCDSVFYADMVRQLEAKPWYRRIWLRGAAWRYWVAVRWCGRRHFHYGERRGWDDVEQVMQRRMDRGE